MKRHDRTKKNNMCAPVSDWLFFVLMYVIPVAVLVLTGVFLPTYMTVGEVLAAICFVTLGLIEEFQQDWKLTEHTKDPQWFHCLGVAGTCLNVMSILFVVFQWIFGMLPYRRFVLVCLCLAVFPMALSVAFPKNFSLAEVWRMEQRRESYIFRAWTRRSYSLYLVPTMFAAFLGLVPTIFNVWEWGTAFTYAAILGVILVLLLWIMHRKSEIGCEGWIIIFFSVLVLSLSIVTASNYIFDRSAAFVNYATVTGKYETAGKFGSCYFQLDGDVVPDEMEVGGKLYRATSEGDTVVFAKYSGALGITYADIWSVDEWEAVQAETN